jgi:cell division protein FtsB
MRIAHRSAGRPIRGGIRWDRLPGNWLIAIVLAMTVLYVPPLHSYYTQRKQTSAQKAQLQSLGKENRALRARAKALRRDSTIELEAHKLGMVKNGERPYVILK